jgi:hypothetical protein
MPLSIRVDSETERLLLRLARKKGLTKSQVVREAIGSLAKWSQEAEKGQRPYDIIEDLIGCVKGGPIDLSVKTGQGFRRILQRKAAPGR